MENEVVLIYPKLQKGNLRQKPLLPLPVLALAGPLKQNGFKVRILDEQVEDVYEQLSRLNSTPICFGISSMMGPQIKSALKIARKIRELKPSCPIVWGGWFPTVLPNIVVTSPHADIVVKGKGETIFLEVVRTIADKRSLKNVEGVVFKENGQILETSNRPLDDPNIFPKPAYHLLDLSKYCVAEGRVNYTSSYGCPFRCKFCGIAAGLGRKWNGGLKAQRVVDELEELVKTYGVKHVIFHEDNFCLNPKRAKEVLNGIAQRHLDLSWEINTRVDQMVRFDPELLKLLKASDRSWLGVGVESAVQSMLDFVQKDITVEQVEKVVQMAKEYNLPLGMNIIAGLPTETPAGFMQTLRKMKSFLDFYPKLKIMLYQYGPVPGTQLYEFEKQQGKLYEHNTLEEWADATAEMSFSVFDYHDKLARYTNRIYRIISFYFGCAYLYSMWLKKSYGPIVTTPFKILSLMGALRFRYDFWALPLEWEIAKFARKLLKLQ